MHAGSGCQARAAKPRQSSLVASASRRPTCCHFRTSSANQAQVKGNSLFFPLALHEQCATQFVHSSIVPFSILPLFPPLPFTRTCSQAATRSLWTARAWGSRPMPQGASCTSAHPLWDLRGTRASRTLAPRDGLPPQGGPGLFTPSPAGPSHAATRYASDGAPQAVASSVLRRDVALYPRTQLQHPGPPMVPPRHRFAPSSCSCARGQAPEGGRPWGLAGAGARGLGRIWAAHLFRQPRCFPVPHGPSWPRPWAQASAEQPMHPQIKSDAPKTSAQQSGRAWAC